MIDRVLNGCLLIGSPQEPRGIPQLQWTNMPQSWQVFVLLLACAAVAAVVFGLYRREQGSCPSAARWVMAGFRFAALIFFVAILLRPAVYYQQINEIKPNIDLIRDASLSLDRGDQYRDAKQVSQLANQLDVPERAIAEGGLSRRDLLNQALVDQDWVRAVRDKGAIQVVDFSDARKIAAVIPAIVQTDLGDKPPRQPVQPGSDFPSDDLKGDDSRNRDSVPELVADGLGTDIWYALKGSLDDASNLSAIVLFSDGQHNGTEDPVEMAIRAGKIGVPIYTVGIGDPYPPRNISVSEVFTAAKAYPDEPFEIEASIQYVAAGEASTAQSVPVELLIQRVNERTGELERAQPISQQKLNLPGGGGKVRLDLEHTIAVPGQYVFSLKAGTIDNETTEADNLRQSAVMEVVDEKVRVLLISGLPSWDFQQVQRLLQRDSSIELSCWQQSQDQTRPQEGDRPISRLPRTIEEIGEYNVVMMMDPDPQEFDADWIEALKSFCKNKAGGLMFMAGPQFTSEFTTLNRLQGIREMLPVRLGDLQFIDNTDALALTASHRPADMLLVRHNLDHPVLSFFADSDKNEQLWRSMPGIYWSFPVMGVKPTARVLLERGQTGETLTNTPLMATGRFGAGNVLFIGFQGTWLWRSVGVQSQYFDRFWIQVVRFLVENRSLQGSRRGFLDSEKTEYELGDRIALVGRVLDEHFSPATQPTFPLRITSDEARIQRADLQLLPGSSGQYEATIAATRTGTFEATIEFPDSTAGDGLIEPVVYRVVPPKVESNAYWLNEKLLKEIADKSGGRYLRLDEYKQLVELLPRQVKRVSFRSPSRPLWDWNDWLRYTAFLLPVVLLGTEWALRKWYKLL